MIVYYLVTALHVLVCVILILVVLLQSGKGADLAGAFGGGGTQTAFGSRGPASFLSKLTTGAAVIFMFTCLTLSLMGEKREAKSVMDSTKGKPAPASKAPASTQRPAPAPSLEQIKKMQEEAEAKQKQTTSGAQATPAPSEKAPAPAAKPEATKSPEKETKAPSGQKP